MLDGDDDGVMVLELDALPEALVLKLGVHVTLEALERVLVCETEPSDV